MAKKHNAPEKPALEPKEALFQAVSLCRKAGALTMGFDAVEEAVVKGKAWLVMQPMHWRAGIFFCAIRFSLLRQVFCAYSAAVSSVFSASAAFGSSSP